MIFSKKQKVCFFFLFSLSFLSYSHGAMPEQKVDVLVLGSGVGGLTSSIYLARSGLKPLVIEGSVLGGAITQSNGVQNWPGEFDITGFDLIEKIRSQAEKNGVVLSQEEVISADLSSKPYSFTLQNIYDSSKKRKVLSDLCIIATGAKPRKLEIPGEATYWSKGVYTCAVCDGSLYKNQVVAVVGGGDSAVLEADYLSGIAKKVYLLVRKDKLKGMEKNRSEQLATRPNIEIVYDVQVQEIAGSESALEKISILHKSGKKEELAVDAVFLAIGAIPNTQIFASQLELDPEGYIVLKKNCETSVPGVFAIGDVTDPIFKQAISAAGDGAKAAIQAQMAFSVKQPALVEKKLTAQVIEIKDVRHFKEILKESKVPVIIDFYATWCGPCRYLSPFMDGWAKELDGKVCICKVNVDEAADMASFYKIRSMPTVIQVDSQGKEIARKVGPQDIIQYVNGLK